MVENTNSARVNRGLLNGQPPEPGSVPGEVIPIADVYSYTPEAWAQIKDDVLALSRYAQSLGLLHTDDIEEWCSQGFKNPHPDTMQVLLKEGNRLIGYSLAHRNSTWSDEANDIVSSPDTATVSLNVIDPEYHGQGYIGPLSDAMERVLLSRGFNRFFIYAVHAGGYSDKVEEHYGDRVLYKGVHPEYRFMSIAL